MIRFGILWLLLMIAPWFSPHDPLEQYREYPSAGPQCGEPCFLLGTDSLGRDVLSRTLYGGRISLAAGLGATLIALAVGGLFGSLAALLGGWADEALSRPFELLQAMPWLYVLLGLRAALPLGLEPNATLLVLFAVLGIAGAGGPFRLARNQVQATLQGEAVQASMGLGADRWHILRYHLLPATGPALAAHGLVLAPQFIVAEVSLSFLGLGLGEPGISWGSQLGALRDYTVLMRHWWMFAPAAMLAVVSVLVRREARQIRPQ